MEELLKVLEKVKPGVDFTSSNDIVKDGLLTSLDIMTLVLDLNDEFDIEIGIEDLKIENFKTLEAIWYMIQKLK